MTEMAEQLPAESKPKKKFEFPSAFTILFLLLVLIAAATFIIPAGTYDYNEDGEPVPGTYHEVPSNPQKLLVSGVISPSLPPVSATSK